MGVCYGCLQPFAEALPPSPPLISPDCGGDDDCGELFVEEPRDAAPAPPLSAAVSTFPSLGGVARSAGVVSVAADTASALDVGDALTVPAPDAAPAAPPPPDAVPQLRFHVAVSGLFGYDVYLSGAEGAQLTIGCARDNDIVLPHTESRRHVLRLYYSQGAVWAEDKGSTQQASIGGIPLRGTRCLAPGAAIEVGSARITRLDFACVPV
jgi:hypothetical protein